MSNGSGSGRVISAALLLGIASLGSRVIGIIRERVLTTTFGAGDVFDAFVAAFRLPDLIFNLVVVGALSAAFIPLFTEKLVKGKDNGDSAERFAVTILNLVLIMVVLLSGIFVILAPYIIPIITPGFAGDKLQTTVELSRIMAIQPILLAVSFICSGVLNSYKRFVAYALAPILYNVGIIIGVVWLYPWLGVQGLAWGVVLGAILHLAIQLPSMAAIKFRWRPILDWQSAEVGRLRRMIIPRIFGLAAQQVNLFVVTIIGSGLAAGTIAVFHVANNIQSLPIGVFGLAFAQAAFPTLAEQVARKQEKAFRHTLTKSFRYILFFVIPTSVIFFLLRAQIVRILFGDGAFDWEDTILTFRTFGVLIMSLFAQATIPLLTRAFYVKQNTKTPVIISFVSIVANVLFAMWLVPHCNAHYWLLGWRGVPCGVEGLAMAFSLSAILNLVLLLGTLHWTLDGFDDEEVLKSLLKITVASLIAGIVIQILKYVVAWLVTMQPLINMQTVWGVLIQLTVAAGGGTLTYLALCVVLRCDELAVIRRFLPRKWRLKPGTETPRFGGLLE